jgi:hypothetical protein
VICPITLRIVVSLSKRVSRDVSSAHIKALLGVNQQALYEARRAREEENIVN